MKPPISILGGTFSPIHYGHLRPAEQVRKQLNLSEIRLMPCHRPPHREDPGVSSQTRAEMVKLACLEYPHFKVDLRELERDDPSYTVVTLGQMQKELPDTPLCFLIGMDSLLSFKKWYRWQDILKRCHLIVSYRPGWQLDKAADIQDLLEKHQTQNPVDIHNTLAGHIYLAEIDEQNVSSTQIRAYFAQGQSSEGLLPEAVAAYIRQNGLYS